VSQIIDKVTEALCRNFSDGTLYQLNARSIGAAGLSTVKAARVGFFAPLTSVTTSSHTSAWCIMAALGVINFQLISTQLPITAHIEKWCAGAAEMRRLMKNDRGTIDTGGRAVIVVRFTARPRDFASAMLIRLIILDVWVSTKQFTYLFNLTSIAVVVEYLTRSSAAKPLKVIQGYSKWHPWIGRVYYYYYYYYYY